MPSMHWTCLGLWLLLIQGDWLCCEAYHSSSNHFSNYGSGYYGRSGASTYNFDRQTIAAPNAFFNATLYCGLFSITYDTSCKFGSINAYVTGESAVCNENDQSNCQPDPAYSSMSCSGFVCYRAWDYGSLLDSVCLVLTPQDPLLPAICDVQITGTAVNSVIVDISKRLGLPIWKAALIAIGGFIGLCVLLFLLWVCCVAIGGDDCGDCCCPTKPGPSQPTVSPEEPHMQAGYVQQMPSLYAGPPPPGYDSTVGGAPQLRDPRLEPPYMPGGPAQPSFMPPQQMEMTGMVVGTPASPAELQAMQQQQVMQQQQAMQQQAQQQAMLQAQQQQEQAQQQQALEHEMQALHQQEEQLKMKMELAHLHQQELALRQQEQALQARLGHSYAPAPQGSAPVAHDAISPDMHQV